jgi:hypothetical protein
LPHSYVTVDTIDLGNSASDVIDVFQSVDDFYALFSEKSAIGPFRSKEELLKHVILRMAENSERLINAVKKIEDTINSLYSVK